MHKRISFIVVAALAALLAACLSIDNQVGV